MMDRIERKMKRLLLASIGAAAVTREQSDSLLNALIEKGEEVIKAQYDMVTPFYADGYSVVKLDGYYGVINEKGEYVLNPEYGSIYYPSYPSTL